MNRFLLASRIGPPRFWQCLVLALCVSGAALPGHAYSVLSHEEVVDMAWPQYLLPLLQRRYPGLTDAQMTECHAYAYGGSVIQDIGYYPFGDHEFSNLLHYVRSGDFVSALLADATTPDEYAFALGALAHYYGDTIGHQTINLATGEEYPRLRTRFGRVVTYGDDETAHLRTEFGFDVVEVAHGNYSQQNYRDFIGFQVAQRVLGQAFEQIYGLPIDHVLKHEDLAIGTYRYAVSTLIPETTRVALATYHDQVVRASPGAAKQTFLYRMRRTDYEKDFGKQYQRPGPGARFLAFLLRLIPKIGPLRALQLHLPNSDEQTQYLASVDKVEDAYRAQIGATASAPAAAPPSLPELDFDTGAPTREGEYRLADQTYAALVEQLAGDAAAQLRPALTADIRHFYADSAAPDALRAKPKQWKKLQSALAGLRSRGLTSVATRADAVD